MAGGHGAMAMTPHVLIVAGSDSSGGAGIARDIETVAAFGLRSCLAVTAVTVQTHAAVEQIEHMPPQLIIAQMRAAFAANTVAAVKIGMLGTAAAIEAVGAVLAAHPQVPVVLDPVLASSSGRILLETDAIEILRRDLMPRCRLVTPNLVELASLNEAALAQDEHDARLGGEVLSRKTGTAVLVKGGHAEGTWSVDLLLQPNRGSKRLACEEQCAGRAAYCPAPLQLLWRGARHSKQACTMPSNMSLTE
jgi:hydroxymethylpyrimidine/phosphomethylpyrimidine kinase